MRVGTGGGAAAARFRERRVPWAMMALLLAACTLPAGCADEDPVVELDWHDGDGFRWADLPAPRGDGAGFEPVPASVTGIRLSNDVDPTRAFEDRTLTHGAGAALADVDGDGWTDLYLFRITAPNALYRNLGGWRFEDVTDTWDAALDGVPSRGGAFGDLDGDGDPDLVVAVHGGRNLMLRNTGDRFEVVESGFEGEWGSNSVAIADADGDGDLDLYIANYKRRQADDLFSPEERAMERVVERVPGGGIRIARRFEDHYRAARVGDMMRRWELAEPDEFYTNDGSGGLTPRALPDPAARDWGLVARFVDLEPDGDPDLYIANDFGSPDGIWINRGEGRFEAAAPAAFETTSASSMAVAVGDIDRDGRPDLFTGDMLAMDDGLRRRQVTEIVFDPIEPGRPLSRVPAPRNALLWNRGDGSFAEIGQFAGVAASDWTWGALFLDADLDGFEDLFVTTGHAFDPLDGDTQAALRAGEIAIDWRRELSAFPSLRLPNRAFRNTGEYRFETVKEGWGIGREADISHTIAPADLDGDGDLDLVVTRLGEPPALYRNQANAPRVAVRLSGRSPNTAAIGAQVTVRGGPVEQRREVAAGGLYLGGGDTQLAFATGNAARIEIAVAWPNGERSRLQATPGRVYEVQQPDPAFAASRGAEAGGGEGPSVPPAWFERVRVPGLVHEDRPSDEARAQPLLPIRLGHLGPGISWADFDDDGDPDLILPAGAAGRTLVSRNREGVLGPAEPWGAATALDQTTALLWPGPDRKRIVVGVSNYEAASADEVGSSAGVREWPDGSPALGGALSGTGPLALGDLDGDGPLELFVGGRAIPRLYPLPASSRVVRAGPTGYELDEAATGALEHVGLVSGAVFSDVDGDGDPDLVLALDWGPLRLFANEAGRLVERSDEWGLSETGGRWNGLATGDFDADGRPDLVATAWGLNTEWVPDRDRPVVLTAADLDGNGTLDLLFGQRGGDGVERPLDGYLRLRRALPGLGRLLPDHGSFARAAVRDLTGGATDLWRATAASFAHTVWLNRGGRFEARELPARAQWAPAFGVAVADFDANGTEDLVLAQNFSYTDADTPPYRAGRGLVLSGKGDGSFEPLAPSRSGLSQSGDGRGLAVADFDRDGRPDVAIAQHADEALVFRGVSARRGLRVRLSGPPANPAAVGASLRLLAGGWEGPRREIQAGSGYWSASEPTQVLGAPGVPERLVVRWPGGRQDTLSVEPGAVEITVAWSDR